MGGEMKRPWETGCTTMETAGDYRVFFITTYGISVVICPPLLLIPSKKPNRFDLSFISVPIIPVYLNEDKPNAKLQDLDAINSTRNNSFASGPSSTISDSSMDFKIGALFASKAFVQVFTVC